MACYGGIMKSQRLSCLAEAPSSQCLVLLHARPSIVRVVQEFAVLAGFLSPRESDHRKNFRIANSAPATTRNISRYGLVIPMEMEGMEMDSVLLDSPAL